MKSNPDGFAAAQYFVVVLAMAGVGLVSHFVDASPRELTFIKVLSIPLMALASYAIVRQFDVDEAYRRWSSALVERVGLSSFVSAAGVTILLARPESPIAELAGFFVVLFVLFALIAAFAPSGRGRR